MKFKRIGPFLALVLLAGSAAPVAAEDTPGGRELHPEIRHAPPPGYCQLDRDLVASGRIETSFEPGLTGGMRLIALYGRCDDTKRAADGSGIRIEDWLAIEMNVDVYPSEDTRRPSGAGAAARLCRNARNATYHPSGSTGRTFEEAVAEARRALTADRGVVFLGVVAEDQRACFLSAVRLQPDGGVGGGAGASVTITAFMEVKDRWIVQSVRRVLDPETHVADILAAARSHAAELLSLN